MVSRQILCGVIVASLIIVAILSTQYNDDVEAIKSSSPSSSKVPLITTTTTTKTSENQTMSMSNNGTRNSTNTNITQNKNSDPHSVTNQESKPSRKSHLGTVAICLFGLVKNVKPNHAEQYVKHLYRPLWEAGYSTVTLLHTYKMNAYVNSRTGENASPEMTMNQNASLELFQNIVIMNDAFKDSSQFIVNISDSADADAYFGNLQQYLKFGDPWPDNPLVSLKSYLRQQYSLLKLSEMLETEQKKIRVTDLAGEVLREKFVGTVFTRPDMLFYDDIDTQLFQFAIKKSDRIALPTWFLYWDTGFNDRFAFGSVDAMLAYGRRGKFLLEYSQAKQPHAEAFLRDYLCSRNYEVHFTRTRLARVRLHGIHAPDSEHGLNYLISANEKRWKDPQNMNKKIEYRGCPRRVWKTFGVDA